MECIDTGVDTPTGGRVHGVRDRLEPFCLTYADGVADIDSGRSSPITGPRPRWRP